jgi:hypothetical protein
VKRALVLVGLFLISLASVTGATGAIFVRLTATTVHRGGVLRLVGDAAGMPLYALPAARMPCARFGTCTEPIQRATSPKRPFVFIGRVPAGSSSNTTPTQPVAIRLPRRLQAGRYKIFVWCERCGGSLIIAGTDSSGQTLRVLR